MVPNSRVNPVSRSLAGKRLLLALYFQRRRTAPACNSASLLYCSFASWRWGAAGGGGASNRSVACSVSPCSVWQRRRCVDCIFSLGHQILAGSLGPPFTQDKKKGYLRGKSMFVTLQSLMEHSYTLSLDTEVPSKFCKPGWNFCIQTWQHVTEYRFWGY